MKSKSNQLNPSADIGAYEFSIDSCNHLISTSLRDLSEKYKNFRPAPKAPADLTKKDLPNTVEETRSESE